MVVSAVPDEVVEAKTSLERHPFAGLYLEEVRGHWYHQRSLLLTSVLARSVWQWLNVVGHFDFVYVPVDCKHFASYGFAFFDDRAEHFQRCSLQCARTCCQDVSFVGSLSLSSIAHLYFQLRWLTRQLSSYLGFIGTSKVLHRAVDITRSSSLPTSTWTCLWGYGRHARLVLPLQRNSHPHCTCENAARSKHRYNHIRPEVVGWAPPV